MEDRARSKAQVSVSQFRLLWVTDGGGRTEKNKSGKREKNILWKAENSSAKLINLIWKGRRSHCKGMMYLTCMIWY